MVDLDDAHGNTADGIHIASCGGTWLALVAGFGGLRDFDGDVRFSPRLPAGWERLRFRIQVRGQLVEVDMTPEGTTYELLEGRGLPVKHFGEQLRVLPGQQPVPGRLEPRLHRVGRCRRGRRRRYGSGRLSRFNRRRVGGFGGAFRCVGGGHCLRRGSRRSGR